MFLVFEQHKYRNLIQSMGMVPYVAKMFFLQIDDGFWLYWCLIQKYLN